MLQYNNFWSIWDSFLKLFKSLFQNMKLKNQIFKLQNTSMNVSHLTRGIKISHLLLDGKYFDACLIVGSCKELQ